MGPALSLEIPTRTENRVSPNEREREREEKVREKESERGRERDGGNWMASFIVVE